MSPQEYLEIERKAECKSEYFEGKMSPKPLNNEQHGVIIGNIVGELKRQLKGKRCRVMSIDLRVRVIPSGLCTYPDIVVVCGESQHADNHEDTLLNPTVLVEVLSDSTRDYDIGRKFQFYRGLPSLREYIMVEQDAPHILQWTRQEEHRGELAEADDLNQTVQLASIGCVLTLRDVYDQVDWAERQDRDRC
jgi:Uma2 family endonuclease